MPTNRETIAWLGLGAMGSRMASRLLDTGWPLRIYNRSPAAMAPLAARGAVACATPREAVAGAQVVLSAVRDDAASRAVWLDPETGAAAGLGANSVALETSTLTPAWIGQLGTALADRGCHLLDAPVVGSRPQAEAGQLTFLVGGPEAALQRARPVLKPLAGGVHHVGDRGMGALLKLTVNASFAIQVAALGELIGVLQRGGLPRGAALSVLSQLPITSPAMQGVTRLLDTEQYAPLFPIALVDKDLRYALGAADALGCALPCTTAAQGSFERADASGLGELNIHAVAKLFEASTP